MLNFYVTFDKDQLEAQVRPHVFKNIAPHHEGWIRFTVEDTDFADYFAGQLIEMIYGNTCADIFIDEDFIPTDYPRGELAVVTEWDF